MPHPVLRTATAAVTAAGLLVGLATIASADPRGDGHGTSPQGAYTAKVLLSGSQLSHPVKGGSEPLSKPDDIVSLGGHLFVGFQNGVGPKGEPSPTGNTASTLVELTRTGTVVRQWDLTGKIDGMGANRATGQLAATVNEDGNSSLYTVDPSAAGTGVTHYAYGQPLPHGGGTDAVTFTHGLMLISASAPASPNGPAVYSVTLQPPASPAGTGTATVTSLFADNASATPANAGAPSQLALTDPDSNTAVPESSPRFGGDFMLDSQGDQQQVYVDHPGTAAQKLSVLALSQSVNDTAFATAEQGALFVTDSSSGTVDTVTGRFEPGSAFVAVTPCNANSAPTTCPAPGFPANYLGSLDLRTGTVSALNVSGATVQPGGMLFATSSDHGDQGHGDQGQGGHDNHGPHNDGN